MSNFNINVDRRMDEQTEKQTPMSQSQEVILYSQAELS